MKRSGGPKKTVAQEAFEAFFQLLMDQRARFQAISAQVGLTAPQAGSLYFIGQAGSVTMSGVAEIMQCDPSNVTSIIDKLEARGLVRRTAAESDRRVKRVVLTEEGRRLCDELGRLYTTPTAWMLALSSTDQRALRDILRRALAHVGEQPAAATPLKVVRSS